MNSRVTLVQRSLKKETQLGVDIPQEVVDDQFVVVFSETADR